MAIDFTPDAPISGSIDFTPDPPDAPESSMLKDVAKGAGDIALGTVDTALSLIPAPLQWMMQTGLESGAIAGKSLVNMGAGRDAVADLGGDDIGSILGEYPEVAKTPQQIVDESKALGQKYVGDKFYQPQTEMGRGAMELVGKGIEKFLTPSHMAGEFAGKFDPRLGYFTGLAGELLQFGLTHVAASKAKSRLKGAPPPIVPEGAYRKAVEGKAEELGVPKDATEAIIEEIKRVEDAEAIKNAPVFKAKHEANQGKAEALRREAATRSGRRKSAYTKAASIIENSEVEITLQNLDLIAKGKDAKTRVLVRDMIEAELQAKGKPYIDEKGNTVIPRDESDVPGFAEEPKAEVPTSPEAEGIPTAPPVVKPPVSVEVKPVPVAEPVAEAKVEPVVEPKLDIVTLKSLEDAKSKYEFDENAPIPYSTARTDARMRGQEGLPGSATIRVGKKYYRATEKVPEVIEPGSRGTLEVGEEPLYLVEGNKNLWRKPKKSDSEWLKLNKEAVVRSGEGKENPNFDKISDELNGLLIELLAAALQEFCSVYCQQSKFSS